VRTSFFLFTVLGPKIFFFLLTLLGISEVVSKGLEDKSSTILMRSA